MDKQVTVPPTVANKKYAPTIVHQQKTHQTTINIHSNTNKTNNNIPLLHG